MPSDSGPHRKYCGLNDAGRAQLARSATGWRSFAAAVDSIVREVGPASARRCPTCPRPIATTCWPTLATVTS